MRLCFDKEKNKGISLINEVRPIRMISAACTEQGSYRFFKQIFKHNSMTFPRQNFDFPGKVCHTNSPYSHIFIYCP